MLRDKKEDAKEKKENIIHNIIMEGRKKLSVSGVTDVESFSDRAVLLYTKMGELTVRGRNIRVSEISVDSGDMQVEGEIDSLVYGSKSRCASLGLIGKLFK